MKPIAICGEDPAEQLTAEYQEHFQPFGPVESAAPLRPEKGNTLNKIFRRRQAAQFVG